VKVYLDLCCLNRLTDNQSQPRIREEAEAVESVLAAVRTGSLRMISSEALEDEARRNPSMERRLEVETFLALASNTVEISEAIARRARTLVVSGYGVYDALHIAAAESVDADILLTTDDRLIRRGARGLGPPRIRVRNPVFWMKEQGL
jgi:predicted nucleic acid-binding protein